MVAEWGTSMYGKDAGGITSAVKLAYVLEYNAKYLGIIAQRADGKILFTIQGA
jgi:hypothetical protein